MKKILLLASLAILLNSCTSIKKIDTDMVEVIEYKLPDTGQSRVFDENGELVENIDESSIYYGADATIEGNVLSYRDNGDGTVTDLNTGLMWQQTPDFSRYTYDEALAYCEDLNTGEYDDWRLPSIKELYSLAHFDGTAFTKSDNIMVPGCYVRAVRGNTDLYNMDYTDNGDGTVSDNSTGLMWTQNDSGETMDWLEALEYAKNSEVSGYSDWRLPNSKELQSLVDYDKTTFPAINTEFFNLTETEFDSEENSNYFWTSTTQGDFKYTACYITFAQAWSKKNSDATTYYDWHGAGAQRSDPKTGTQEEYELASEMATDYISINNYVRLVRDIK